MEPQKRSSLSQGEEDGTGNGPGKKQCVSYANMNAISIMVGAAQAIYDVHEHKLCEESGFFRAALNSGFKESSEQTIYLPDDDVETVDYFTEWIYAGKLPELSPETLANMADNKSGNAKPDMHRLCRLFVFAEKYDIPGLKRCAIYDLLRIAAKCRPHRFSTIQVHYQETGTKSGLRRLLCDWYVRKLSPRVFDTEEKWQVFASNPEWAADLLGACARNWRKHSSEMKPMEGDGYL